MSLDEIETNTMYTHHFHPICLKITADSEN